MKQQQPTAGLMFLTTTTIVLIMTTTSVVLCNENSTMTTTIDLSSVLLPQFNLLDFHTLIQNVSNSTTNSSSNETLNQLVNQLVLRTSSYVGPATMITLRSVLLLLVAGFFLPVAIVFRNREPLKAKFGVSVMLLVMSLLHNSIALVDHLPAPILFFTTYWNEFVASELSGVEFYGKNLVGQVPSWMAQVALWDNVICYYETFVVDTYVVVGLSIYFVQMGKFILQKMLNEKQINLKNAIDKIKERKLEKLKKKKKVAVPSQPVTPRKQTVEFSDSESVQSSSTSASSQVLMLNSQKSNLNLEMVAKEDEDGSTMTMPVDLEDIFLTDFTGTTDDDNVSTIAEDFTRTERISRIIRFVINRYVLQITVISFLIVLWFVLSAASVVLLKLDSKFAINFPAFKSVMGLCTREMNSMTTGVYTVAIGAVCFIMIPVLLLVDFAISLRAYVKLRKEKGDQMVNFVTHFLIDTDPFVYRIEAMAIMTFSLTAVIILIISIATGSNLVIDVLVFVFLDALGGPLSNPGATIYMTLINVWRAASFKKMSTQPTDQKTISNIQQLLKVLPSEECIDFLISSPKERNLFYDYLCQEFSSENLLFVEDVFRLRNMQSDKVRSKLLKLHEIHRLYLTERDSIFEVNVSRRVIQSDLDAYHKIAAILHQYEMKLEHLPKVFKSAAAILPSEEDDRVLKELLQRMTGPTVLSNVMCEVYKNLLDSYLRFINSRLWKNYLSTFNA